MKRDPNRTVPVAFDVASVIFRLTSTEVVEPAGKTSISPRHS